MVREVWVGEDWNRKQNGPHAEPYGNLSFEMRDDQEAWFLVIIDIKQDRVNL